MIGAVIGVGRTAEIQRDSREGSRLSLEQFCSESATKAMSFRCKKLPDMSQGRNTLRNSRLTRASVTTKLEDDGVIVEKEVTDHVAAVTYGERDQI